jgi:hypothetical protein
MIDNVVTGITRKSVPSSSRRFIICEAPYQVDALPAGKWRGEYRRPTFRLTPTQVR